MKTPRDGKEGGDWEIARDVLIDNWICIKDTTIFLYRLAEELQHETCGMAHA